VCQHDTLRNRTPQSDRPAIPCEGTRGGLRMSRVEDIEKHFGALHVLKGVSLEVQKGEVLVIIGPSGSGKSTLLRCINLLIEPDSGRVFLTGTQVNRRDLRPEWVREQVGMVFQS